MWPVYMLRVKYLWEGGGCLAGLFGASYPVLLVIICPGHQNAACAAFRGCKRHVRVPSITNISNTNTCHPL